jgi:hypothetical protein
MSSANHDTFVYRLAQMLVKLNLGEKLFPNSWRTNSAQPAHHSVVPKESTEEDRTTALLAHSPCSDTNNKS